MELIKKWSENYVEAGCDEVGRGCLCGPVVAAAVILDDIFEQNLVNDSKKLNFKNYTISWKWAFRYQWIIAKK